MRAKVGEATASASFTATTALPVARLEKISGDGAACPTQTKSCTFVVRSVDVNGVPVPGVAVRWSSPNACGAPTDVTTDALGLATSANICSTVPAGVYTQTATLLVNQQQVSFLFSLRGVSLSLESVDTSGVTIYSVTSATTQADGLTVTIQYRSGPAKDYITRLDLNRTSTPALLTLDYASLLPIGDYTYDIIVSTTTPGLGPAVKTVTFNPSSGFFTQPNAQRQPTSRRVPVAPRAP